ncbi:MAG: type II toxin-antitoxin system death-on-curing family toxin, partial [Gammaproteobacteria bacterium]
IVDLAAAYAERICKNHPFIDGNKRTAYVTMLVFLDLNGYTLVASREERVIKFVQLASSTINLEEFTTWLEQHVQKV